MSKKADKVMGNKDDSDALPLPDSQPGLASPRGAREGFGREGEGGRRERGLGRPQAGFAERTSQFLHDVRAELRRVSWPTANQVKNTTIITLVAVVFFAVYLFVVDQLIVFFGSQLNRLINWLFGGA